MKTLILSLSLLSVFAADSVSAREPKKPKENPALAPQGIAEVPFLPTAVFRDGESLFVFRGQSNRLAKADLEAKKIVFSDFAADHLDAGSSVAVHSGLVYISHRASQEVVVLDSSGKIKHRFRTSGPPSAIAVDGLGAVHVFSVLPRSEATDGLLTVYSASGSLLRSVGQLPDENDSKRGRIERRGAAMPLLRTDARGDVWALLRDGKTAIKVGITEKGQDVVDLSGVVEANFREQKARQNHKATQKQASISETEEDPEKAREKQVLKELDKARERMGVKADDPNVKTVVLKPPVQIFSDFACGDRECIGLLKEIGVSASGGPAARVLVFDVEENTQVKEFELGGGNPDSLVGVTFEDNGYSLYAVADGRLLLYRLDGI